MLSSEHAKSGVAGTSQERQHVNGTLRSEHKFGQIKPILNPLEEVNLRENIKEFEPRDIINTKLHFRGVIHILCTKCHFSLAG